MELTLLLGRLRAFGGLAAAAAVTKGRSIPRAAASRMTPEGFGLLLAALGGNDLGASEYERLRSKLIFFFTRRLLAFPEDLADVVLDRLAQRLAQGTEMNSVEAFALGIARYVAQEQQGRKVHIEGVDPDFFDNVSAPPATLNREEEIVRMEQCLKRLSRAECRLLRGYYLAAGGSLISARKKLLETLGVPATTLRQRVFLARQRLRDCMIAKGARER